VQILVLDACRNNPFAALLARKQRSRDIAIRGGLAPIRRTQGMLIAYATQANDVATDGGGKNSPFTEALAHEIRRPGKEIAAVFRNVQVQVYTATKGRQLPELSISLLGDFYFNTGETDVDVWRKVSLSNNRQELAAFIKNYPESNWTESARMRLVELAEKEHLLQKSAEREQFIRELSSRAEQLGEQIKQAEEKRLEAVEKLESREQIPSQVKTEQATKAEAEAHSKSQRERLAAAVHEQENLVLTLSAERQRIEAERKAAERASDGRLKIQKWTPDPVPLRERKASLDKVDRPPLQPPSNTALAGNIDHPPALKCADIISRLQLGEQTQSDLNALKQCER
jgi:hypothetical protein